MKDCAGGRLQVKEPLWRRGCAITGVRLAVPLALVIVTAGCQGRAEFYRGQDLLRAGREREAFYQFWEASRQDPSAANLRALLATGRRVAAGERAAGRRREARADFDGALYHYGLGLEYDARWALLAEDYARVAAWVGEWKGLEEELRRSQLKAAAGPAPASAWRELDLLLAMESHPARGPAWAADLAAAARRGVEAQAAPMREPTFRGPLPEAPADLLDLARSWLSLADSCRVVLYGLESPPSLAARHPGADPRLAPAAVLRQGIDEAESGLRLVDRAIEGARLYQGGTALEAEGKLLDALRAYTRAACLHPAHEAAKAARARVRERFAEENYREALVALHREEWRRALEALERLLGFAPAYRDAEQLLVTTRRKLAAQHVLEARRHQEAGLFGNALVRYYLAAALDRSDPKIQAAIRELEQAIENRVRPRVQVAVRPGAASPGRREEWGVDRDIVWSLAGSVAARSQAALDRVLERAAEPGGGVLGRAGAPGEPPSGGALVVWVDDLDFSCPRLEGQSGFERVKYVKAFQLEENPERARARLELHAAREELDRALAAAALPAGVLRRDVVTLARRNLQRFETKLASLAEEVPAVLWDCRSYPVSQILREARLSALYRLGDGASPRAVSAALEFRDRVVKGDPDANVPQDPEEIPSSAAILASLAADLGEELARDVVRELLAERESFYKRALERYEARSFDVAAENLVLFLYSRRGKRDASFQLAALLLEKLTGCNLTTLWRDEG